MNQREFCTLFFTGRVAGEGAVGGHSQKKRGAALPESGCATLAAACLESPSAVSQSLPLQKLLSSAPPWMPQTTLGHSVALTVAPKTHNRCIILPSKKQSFFIQCHDGADTPRLSFETVAHAGRFAWTTGGRSLENIYLK